MLKFGIQTPQALVWGQRTPTWAVSNGDDVAREANIHHWMSMPGQTTGGIGLHRPAAGQPLVSYATGAYVFSTYVTTYAYAGGSYSFALQTNLLFNEVLNMHDSVIPNAIFGISLSSALTLHDTNVVGRVTFITANETLSLHDALTVNGILGIVLPESLLLSDQISSNAALLAYVVNANTLALTTYNNYNFNSFAKLGGKYYGAADDGIYELSGANDNGTQIAASVTLGKQDFNSELLKTMPSVYVGLSATGAMILKVVTDTGSARLYKLATPTNTTALQSGRFKLGRGVTSRYWQFELQNVDGSDFTLDSITLHTVVLSRRIMER